MFEALLEEAHDVEIVEVVEDHAAVAARANEAHPAQQPELVRHGGFAQAEQPRDVAHAQFGSRQGVEDSYARRVAEHAEGLGEGGDAGVAEHARAQRSDLDGVEMKDVARLEGRGGAGRPPGGAGRMGGHQRLDS